MTVPIDVAAALGLHSLPAQWQDDMSSLLWSREVMQKYISSTFEVKNAGGIEELKSVNIGGVDQWLHVRGRDRKNPILLVIHGGPGVPMLGQMDAVQRPWEDYFTVVQWDQRQAGKSYCTKDDDNNSLKIEQYIQDAEEITCYLRDHLNQEKLFVLGHSWGSALGMHLVKRRPEWLYAYIGVGQIVCQMESEKTIYLRLLAHADEQNEVEIVTKLQEIIPMLDADSPLREKSFVDNCEFVRRELSRLAGETLMHFRSWVDCCLTANLERTISPHLTLTDLSNNIFGNDPALLRPPYTSLTKDFLDIDLPNDIGSKFDIPIFFFTGRHDYQTPVTLSDQWFDQITAPHKSCIHFEASSHMVFSEEPGKFLVSLINHVLPLALVNYRETNAD